ncbi:hypothetical protein ABZ517_05805 [Streptomyces scabiei]|uniref:hypothetical protein n=1 Tax=Streptomyces scabiei TaxID=1930 RepID=UPI0033E5B41E
MSFPLIDGNPTLTAALLRTQRLKDEASKVRKGVEAQGRNPQQAKVVTVAEAEYSGALTVLAHVLAAAGADVLVDALPSHTLTGLYLEEWDRQRHVRAFQRALKGGSS